MKRYWILLLALLSLSLPALADEALRTIIISEGTTDILMEAYAHNTAITDLYLPASLDTLHGEPLEGDWSFGLIYGGNNWHPQEYKLVLHAQEDTTAAAFAQQSGLPYVIEDARGGTDRTAVASWVQTALDAELPGAEVCTSRIGLPAVGYSADTVLAAAQLPDGRLTLCLFSREGDVLTLRWHNDEMLSQSQAQEWGPTGLRWTGGSVPHIMTIRADRLCIAVELHTDLSLEAQFTRREGIWELVTLRLLQDNGLHWYTPTLLRLTEDMLRPGINLQHWTPCVWLEWEEG